MSALISASDHCYRRSPSSASAHDALQKHFRQSSPWYQEYEGLRNKVNATSEHRDRLRIEREKSDNPTNEQQWMYYDGLKRVAQDMHRIEDAFTIKDDEFPPNILDLCMAPGAFLGTALDVNPTAHAVAFTLPPAEGGFRRILPREERLVEQHDLDITSLLTDIGVPLDVAPADHPVISGAVPRRLHLNRKFQLVLCDGSLLRTQETQLSPYRERRRLLLSQLSIGLQHVRGGGTMIVLLYGIEKWETAKLLRQFTHFSDIRVHKPRASHRRKPSFYMIASEMHPKNEAATQALACWQEEWKVATFATQDEYQTRYEPTMEEVQMLIQFFGDQLAELGSSVWATQSKELSKVLSGDRHPLMGGIAQNF